MTPHIVADVMTRTVATVSAISPQPEIDALLARLGVGGVPVVDDTGRPLGVVSAENLVARTRSLAADHAVWLDWLPEKRTGAELMAAELMSAPPDTVAPHTPLRVAAQLLLTDRRRLLVVDTAGQLIGIVTRSDLLRASLAPGRGALGRGGVDWFGELFLQQDELPVAEASLVEWRRP